MRYRIHYSQTAIYHVDVDAETIDEAIDKFWAGGLLTEESSDEVTSTEIDTITRMEGR